MSEIDIKGILQEKRISSKKKKNEDFSSFLSRDIEIFSKSFGDKKKERFYAEINVLFSAGLDIKSTLDLIEQEQTNEYEKNLIRNIKEAVLNGKSFSQALKETGKFTDYEIFTIQLGEETGKLPEVLKDLAGYFAKKIKQKRQIKSALSYPAIVLSTVVGVMVFMMKFMVPMFEDIFKKFKGELPPITKLVISISNFIGSSFNIFFFSFLLLGLLFYSQKEKDWFRGASSALLLKVPVLGKIIQKIYLSRFCHSMNLLLSAKIPLVNALEMIKRMIRFYPVEISIDTLKEDITKGASLHESLSVFSIYPKRMISLVKVGEEVNQVDLIFEKLNHQYNDEVEHQTGTLAALLEPILIIFLGLVIGFVVVAMYLPIFQMSSSIGS